MTAAPGPPGGALFGHVRAFRADPLRFLEDAVAAHGDVVGLRAGRQPAILLRHPDHIRYVLQTHQDNYPKRTAVLDRLGRVLGRGLVNSDGEPWRQQRRRLQSFFQRPAVGRYVDEMAAQIRALAERWADRCGADVDVWSDMMQLAFGIVGRTLLGLDLRAEAEPVRQAVMCLEAQSNGRMARLLDWPLWIPTRPNRDFRRAVEVLDQCVRRIVAGAHATQHPPSPLLSVLLESGPHDPSLARDELVTLLLAGHENTGNALTWMWYLVARDAAIQTAVRDEAVSACGERDPTAADLPRLPLAGAVVAEALRLYPPSWLNLRRARRGDTIGGYRIPAGAWMLISPYLTHRHPAFWPAPALFDPGRFTGTGRAHPDPFAYLPFGDGPRKCIGSHFAIAEMTLALSMLSARFRFAPLHPGAVEPDARVSLLPRGGLRLRVTASSAVPAS